LGATTLSNVNGVVATDRDTGFVAQSRFYIF
jgi:hypothetical protein